MKLVDLCEALYGAYEVIEDPDGGSPQWQVRLDGKVVQQFPYRYGDEEDKKREKREAIRWARAQYGVYTK